MFVKVIYVFVRINIFFFSPDSLSEYYKDSSSYIETKLLLVIRNLLSMLCHSIGSNRLSLAGHQLCIPIAELKQSCKYEILKLNRNVKGKSINSQKSPSWARLEMN